MIHESWKDQEVPGAVARAAAVLDTLHLSPLVNCAPLVLLLTEELQLEGLVVVLLVLVAVEEEEEEVGLTAVAVVDELRVPQP